MLVEEEAYSKGQGTIVLDVDIASNIVYPLNNTFTAEEKAVKEEEATPAAEAIADAPAAPVAEEKTPEAPAGEENKAAE